MLEPLEQGEALVELVHALAAVADMPRSRGKGDYLAARRARDYLHANFTRIVTLDELEIVTGRDRWSLSHDFRTFYGTSPYRYLTMRRLGAVRSMLRAGARRLRARRPMLGNAFPLTRRERCRHHRIPIRLPLHAANAKRSIWRARSR
ncbi:hypothetical protein [Burkholderia anthina]|uniref:hypothetical protein n=1 Tax=Burkholderia anthina TaxID=179879 RepID=UPI00384AC372